MKTLLCMSRWPLLLACLLAAASCGKRDRLVIAVVPKAQAHIFWQTVHAGAVAAAQEFQVDVRWTGPAAEIEYSRQIGIVDDFINQRVDGIALAPTNGEALSPVVERAFNENIPVAIFDSGIRTDKYLTYISTDNHRGGVMAAERMGALFPQGGKIAVIATLPGGVSTMEREAGFKETLAARFPKLAIVDLQYGMSDRSKSLAIAEDILTAHPGLDALFCSAEAGTVGAVQAARSKNVAGKLKIVGFDASQTLIEDLRSGAIDSLVVQNPFRMGYLSVETLVRKTRGETPGKRIDTGATLVTRETLEQPAIRELINPPIAKYLK
jgi:ribose transport system substrate-binding protein